MPTGVSKTISGNVISSVTEQLEDLLCERSRELTSTKAD